MLGVELGDAGHEGAALVGGGEVREGLGEETEVAAEVEVAAAIGPKGAGLLGDDDGLAGGDGAAQERVAGVAAGEEVSEEGGSTVPLLAC